MKSLVCLAVVLTLAGCSKKVAIEVPPVEAPIAPAPKVALPPVPVKPPAPVKPPGYLFPGVVAEKPFAPFDAASPGTLDALDRAKIPADDLLPWYPKELVALIGSPRGYAELPGYSSNNVLGFTADGAHILTWSHVGIRAFDATTLRNVAFLTVADLGGHLHAVNLSPDGRLLAIVHKVGCVEVMHAGGMLKRGRNVSAALDDGYGNFGLFPDNAMAWRTREGRTESFELYDLADPAGKRFLTLPLGNGVSGDRLFADPARKRVALGVRSFDRRKHIEVWSYADAAPKRLASLPVREEVRVVAFAGAANLLAVGMGFDKWSLLKLDGNTLTAVGSASVANHVKAFHFLDDDRRLMVLSDGAVTHYDLADKPVFRRRAELDALAGGHDCGVAWFVRADHRRYVSLGQRGELRVWDAEPYPPRMISPAPTMPIALLAVAPAGTRLQMHDRLNYSTLREWSLVGPTPIASPKMEFSYAKGLAPDGTRMFEDGPGATMLLKRRADKTVERTLKRPEDRGEVKAALSRDGRWAFLSEFERTLVWDLKSDADTPRTLPGRNDYSNPPSLSRDGHYMLVDDRPTVKRIDLTMPPEQASIALFNAGAMRSIRTTLSPTGKLVLIGQNSIATPGAFLLAPADRASPPPRWTAEGKMDIPGIITLRVESPNTTGPVAFTPDERHVAVTDNTNRLALCDTRTGEAIRTFAAWGKIVSLHFADDGRHLIVANESHTVFVLRLELPK